jgi:ribosomal protein L37AE/L43A
MDNVFFLPLAREEVFLQCSWWVSLTLSRRSERERMRVCPECGGESSSRTDEGLLVCDLCGMTLQQVAVHVTAAARVANCDLTAVEQGEEKNEDDDMLVCRV